MPGRTEVHPHPAGPWLVIHEGRSFGVPPRVGAGILDASIPAAGLVPRSREVQKPPSARSGLRRMFRDPLWLRLPLASPAAVRRAAAFLSPLAGPRALGLSAAVGLGGYGLAWAGGWQREWPVLHEGGLVPGLVLFLVTAVWHELGHAAALARQGYPPGRLGIGVMVVIPVLFVDVTPVALLPPRGRLVVNAAGASFQLGIGGILALAAGTCEAGWLRDASGIAAGSALGAVLWSLWPFIRSDGYWLVADLLGVGALDRPLPPEAGCRARTGILLHRATNLAFIVAAAGLVTWTAASRLGPAGPWGTAGAVLIAALVWWGAVARGFRLVGTLRRDFGTRAREGRGVRIRAGPRSGNP
ncbi:MAG: hypothetical protein AB7V45_00240 [Candidatus Krumholzibacteriia bacterium]